MSTTAGVFSETTLLNIRAMADKIMFDDRTKLNFIARADAMQAFSKLQTANVNLLEAKKDYTIEVEWINNCAIEASDTCTSCDVGGEELSTNIQEVKLNQCAEVKFSVKGYKMIDNDFDAQQLIAQGLLTADIRISELINQNFITWLVTNAGVNEFNVAGEIGAVVGNETQIAAANYTLAAIPYMIKVMGYNNMTNPILMSGNQLMDLYRAAGFTAGTYGNVGQINAITGLAREILWDLYGFTQTGYNDRMIGISTGAIAFASKSYYGPNIENFGKEGMWWSAQSRFVPGLTLEIHMNYGCENDHPNYDFKVKTKYDFLLNPEGCRANNNGILQFTQV